MNIGPDITLGSVIVYTESLIPSSVEYLVVTCDGCSVRTI